MSNDAQQVVQVIVDGVGCHFPNLCTQAQKLVYFQNMVLFNFKTGLGFCRNSHPSQRSIPRVF